MKTIEKNGIYFISGIKEIVLSVGGQFNDVKERPIVALMQSHEIPEIFWSIPVGDLSHRNQEQLNRIQKYLNYPKDDIRSCFYHIGNTNKKSLFFISDIFPINADYIDREYLSFNNQVHVIKNKTLISALNEKTGRILSYEQSKITQTGKFYFRQNIFGVYSKVKEQLESKNVIPKADEEAQYTKKEV